jgi:hypothetical protein
MSSYSYDLVAEMLPEDVAVFESGMCRSCALLLLTPKEDGILASLHAEPTLSSTILSWNINASVARQHVAPSLFVSVSNKRRKERSLVRISAAGPETSRKSYSSERSTHQNPLGDTYEYPLNPALMYGVSCVIRKLQQKGSKGTRAVLDQGDTLANDSVRGLSAMLNMVVVFMDDDDVVDYARKPALIGPC